MFAITPSRWPDEPEYPASDGEPMAETDVHRDEMAAAIDVLKARYRSRRDVYVAGNLFVYYEEGNTAARFAPDVLVVMGARAGQRRTYKLWEEKRTPSFVLEVSSRKTWLEDKGNKMTLCAGLGVAEYFLFDPEQDYLEPPLQGHRLVGRAYRPIARGADGSVRSSTLGLLLRAEGSKLRFIDGKTGEQLLRPEEVRDAQRAEARARRKAETERRKAETERRKAETRLRKAEGARQDIAAALRAESQARRTAELELARLRKELARAAKSRARVK